MPAKLKQRAERKSAKREEKKRQIAQSAIEALKELGYANTSLRDIAEKSDLSLGMLHYYFEDRSDLIIYCVSIYKQAFVREIASALTQAEGRDQVIAAFSNALVTSIFDDGMIHRLWYDIRTQAMFDETFRPVVAEIEEMLIDIVRTAYEKAGQADPAQVEIRYALLDGVFRLLMQRQIGNTARPRAELLATFNALLGQFF
ncbi:TetR/AcrR family transcriptional regulator [Ruegeria sp. PrR005]|uniref:TetR/AcrR family transcriptional regulator n=1 Tax=Ruegeria sp. PrR005 TaxID=2706882 RepID=A0A6B2NSU7_9RHOB|nr:TetR/AcrR family transcriptional regulator [Ruegeria sp. PrR005]NDW45484.1 TetR/AcrR family transcriptional regulator [Ruegeria sp. PrR005]